MNLFLILPALLAAEAGTWQGAQMAQANMSLRERIIIRIPLPGLRAALSRRPAAPPPMTRWRTRKGPRCVPLSALAGAQVAAPASVDLILKGGMRVRAALQSSCPALDYYGGFYLRPTDDGKVCADRDAIHTRAGGACEIERFRRLVAVGQ